ncbi:MAG: hypothetical protein H6Q17_896 [Bacteroidetes bacterium]|nr:hypothetical protein [Bacteroidota bacterium]
MKLNEDLCNQQPIAKILITCSKPNRSLIAVDNRTDAICQPLKQVP